MSDIAHQDSVVQSLKTHFGNSSVIIDRRQQPSHGYRAVNVIISVQDKLIEIQVRTKLQHLWAELSEKFSDVLNPAIKYGGGEKAVRDNLRKLSADVKDWEFLETKMTKLLENASLVDGLVPDLLEEIENLRRQLTSMTLQTLNTLDTIMSAESLRGENDALSDSI